SQTLADPYVRAEAEAFMAQEGQHFRAHRRFNDLLKNRHYPRLATVEDDMAASYARLDSRSLRTRMAYTVGFETMTIGLTRWLVADRVRLFGHVDTRVVSVMLWHMVEEIEHKCVAFDVYQAHFSNSFSGYLARVVGIVHAAVHVIGFSLRGAREILRTEGRWSRMQNRLRLVYWLGCLVRAVSPCMFRAAMPGHDPRKETDPKWVRDWLDGYKGSGIPLVDTAHPDMPVPFPSP
nr:metal-dependent hydrolase [Pseudomonadota bacterium]